jgi:hypothetical protein
MIAIVTDISCVSTYYRIWSPKASQRPRIEREHMTVRSAAMNLLKAVRTTMVDHFNVEIPNLILSKLVMNAGNRRSVAYQTASGPYW